MSPTIEILGRMNQNSANNKDEVFTRVFRYMLRPDIYHLAYRHLYANRGAGTPGVNEDTADGFGGAKITKIIESLKDGSFTPSPCRREYIQKKNSNKKRPLGLPTFTDKLVQEVMRMILEAIYEPVFLPCSHGFRPKRSCHTALSEMKKSFTGVKWFIEGDIKGCFDNIDHHILVHLVNQKIKDARFLQLLWKFLKAGYMEDWRYNATHSGTPQGGIVSPILANIYLHELDNHVNSLKREYDVACPSKYTSEYAKAAGKVHKIRQMIGSATPDERPALILELKAARKEMFATPAKKQEDKKLVYIRYADDFIIGVNGSHEDCEQIKCAVGLFVKNTLKMELSEEKTLITHSSQYARFLGYDICVRRQNAITKPGGQGYTRRTLNNRVELSIPLKDKIERFLFAKNIVRQEKSGKIVPKVRTGLLQLSDLEILTAYNSEIRGLCNFYSLAVNYAQLNYLSYLMEYSCLKTLAAKHKSSIGKIAQANRDGNGKWGIEYKTAKETKRLYFTKHHMCKTTAWCDDEIPKKTLYLTYARSELERRLSAEKCELCGKEGVPLEFHHVNKVKNLKGKKLWEQMMIAKRRKTLAVCVDCHNRIHFG